MAPRRAVPILVGVLAAAWEMTSAVAAVAADPGGATSRLVITSDSSCPSGDAVAQALSVLRPGGDWPSGTVKIHAEERALTVDLGTGSTSQRNLAVVSDCAARAAMVAVVIATWMDDLPAEHAAAPVLTSVAKPEPAAPPQAAAVAGVNQHDEGAHHEYELGAGLLVAGSGGIVPGARADFVLSRTPRGLGWQASLVLPARRELSTAVGGARWTRPSLGLALNGRLDAGSYVLSADAGLAGAYTFVSGSTFAVGQDAQSLTFGIVTGLRVGILWHRLRIWTDLRFCRWLLGQSIEIESASGAHIASADLPSWDAQWSLGLSYVFR
jgi:hypothetical protein